MPEITISPDRLAGIHLAKGSHTTPESGLCFMEFAAFAHDVPHTDRWECVSPVLGEMGRGLNDVLPDDLRQLLKPLALVVPGTAGDGLDEQRSYMALDWLIRTWLPAWLDLVPACRGDAARLRELGRVVDLVAAERAGPVVQRAREGAAAAGDAVGAAAGDAAWAAARDAVGAAAGAALQPTVIALQQSAIKLYTAMTRLEGGG